MFLGIIPCIHRLSSIRIYLSPFQVYIYKDLGQDFSLEINGVWDSRISNLITARADVRGFKCVIVSFLVPYARTGQEGPSDGSLKSFLDLADSQRGEEVDSNSSISSTEDSASSSASSDDSANSESDVESGPKKAPKRSTNQGKKRGREPDVSESALRKTSRAETIIKPKPSSSSGQQRCPP